jgi:CheY-like chemotaxis protein
MNILIAENDQDYRYVLRELLFMSGNTVFVAADGTEAMNILRQNRIDMIISDISMPNGTGVELHMQVRQSPEYARIPFVYLSGHPDLRASVPLNDPDLDFMLSKMTPVQELLVLIEDMANHQNTVAA